MRAAVAVGHDAPRDAGRSIETLRARLHVLVAICTGVRRAERAGVDADDHGASVASACSTLGRRAFHL